jgi:hypothetical protein
MGVEVPMQAASLSFFAHGDKPAIAPSSFPTEQMDNLAAAVTSCTF